MNNEKINQIIDEAYENYLIEDARILPNMSKEKMLELGFRLTKEEFINKCKTDSEFSERWGLKIEERELSYSERKTFFEQHCLKTLGGIRGCETPEKDKSSVIKQYNKWFDEENIPTKLITITYNNETIESYE